ncbi:transmembrane protein, putative [Bodo saltans]|uniref:Transmembrane protein, putative n=1 Tax=Bodo saltans TaxID=75058 RepID=A0A0S4JUS6_BODSA|nr:transmembrane protein, putative [Bodo saltans]|eukprot:CUG93197.1 transmembrane protein, putative [Bodo saltans]
MASSPPQQIQKRNDAAVGNRIQGPQEDHDAGWRTTNSHSPKQMMSVYRELFFAGLPKPTIRGGANRQHDDDDDGDGRGKSSRSAAAGPVVTFPPALVKEMFARFGPITSFHFDVTKGVGAVTYEHGEDAERCFITAHLSLMRGGAAPPGSRVEDIDDEKRSGDNNNSAETALADVFGKFAAVLYIEFAQWLPFVNPLLLDGSVSALTTMNRQLLRTFPVCERRWSPSTFSHVVFNCKAGPVEKNGSSISLPGHGTMADLSLAVALVHTLFPSAGLTKDSKITVLDLWAQFYDQFVVSKTQPDASRISFPEFRFAAKASALQDVVQFCKRALEKGDSEGRMALARFAEDDVLHSTMAYIVFKTRMIHDPSHVSLLRAVDTKYAKLSNNNTSAVSEGAVVNPARTSSCFVGPSARQGLDALISQPPKASPAANNTPVVTPADQWLRLSLVSAASNVIVNASFMYPAATGATPPTSDEEEEARFDRVLKIFDEFASSGSASTMVALCCAPETFKGPTGLPATLPTMQGMLWRTFRIPLMVVAVLGVLMVLLLWWPTQRQGVSAREFDY